MSRQALLPCKRGCTATSGHPPVPPNRPAAPSPWLPRRWRAPAAGAWCCGSGCRHGTGGRGEGAARREFRPHAHGGSQFGHSLGGQPDWPAPPASPSRHRLPSLPASRARVAFKLVAGSKAPRKRSGGGAQPTLWQRRRRADRRRVSEGCRALGSRLPPLPSLLVLLQALAARVGGLGGGGSLPRPAGPW